MRQPFTPDAFDEVILGCASPIADEINPGRIAALRLGCGNQMPGWTVQRNCGSGMQSIDTGYRYVRHGHADLVLAGGTEALSHAPLVFRQETAELFGAWMSAKSQTERLKVAAHLRPHHFKPVIGLERGLTDPVVELNMGQTAEVLRHLFAIPKVDADAYAVDSHQRLARAQTEGWLEEIEPMYDGEGDLYDHDDGVRPDTSLEQLAKLKPAFEPPFGEVTAGNSSQITDGACWVILASEEAIERYKLDMLGRILDSEWAALDPSIMGLGPTLASTALLPRHNLGLADVDAWELNEAFAAQVLACLKAWQDDAFCHDVLGLDQPLGTIDRDRLNVDGGAISLGHPVGTSGARIVLHLLHVLKRQGGKRGIATECIGGGQGGAMLLEAA
jgi:acetyl-CoA C-acetyltransferase